RKIKVTIMGQLFGMEHDDVHRRKEWNKKETHSYSGRLRCLNRSDYPPCDQSNDEKRNDEVAQTNVMECDHADRIGWSDPIWENDLSKIECEKSRGSENGFTQARTTSIRWHSSAQDESARYQIGQSKCDKGPNHRHDLSPGTPSGLCAGIFE